MDDDTHAALDCELEYRVDSNSGNTTGRLVPESMYDRADHARLLDSTYVAFSFFGV